ncbi:MAG: hypothetical protein PHU25_12895 [Deltaproteobacteria bacterium]|nr:hypothetical protein [Deltaproteobacteria bacterium]
MSDEMLHLAIATTWDGEHAARNETASIALGFDDGDLVVEVDAAFHGDPPPSGAPGPTPGLWELEVVELFVLGASLDGEPRYTEIELSPHGHHLVLRLHGVRRPIATVLPLRFDARIAGPRWAGIARLDRSLLPPPPYRVNAYAVHGEGDSRRHLAHAPVLGERPDFHRLGSFVPIEIPDIGGK